MNKAVFDNRLTNPTSGAGESEQPELSTEALSFAIFCVENLALRLNRNPKEVYALLTRQSDILDGYIIPCWKALHTQGKDYILDDLIQLMRERGLKV